MPHISAQAVLLTLHFEVTWVYVLNFALIYKKSLIMFSKPKSTLRSKPQTKYTIKKDQQPLINDQNRKVVLFNKPFDVLCQFTDENNTAKDQSIQRKTLKDYIDVPEVYAAGRLDRDSEGLLLLTNDGKLQAKITEPKAKMKKTYWVQVEGLPSEGDLQKLRYGVNLKDGMTLPAQVEIMNSLTIWPRTPPIRERANIATTWLRISIHEGRNRQVRRMTANIGFPTLRLIRYQIGKWTIEGIENGAYKLI